MTEVAQHFARRQRIPGYRPGKVPLARVIAAVGDEPIRKAALDMLTEQVAREAVKDRELVPAAPAAVEVVAEDPFTVRVLVPLEPLVVLGDYHALRVARSDLAVIDDAVVDAAVEGWRSDLATLQPVDRPAEAG